MRASWSEFGNLCTGLNRLNAPRPTRNSCLSRGNLHPDRQNLCSLDLGELNQPTMQTRTDFKGRSISISMISLAYFPVPASVHKAFPF